MKPTALRPRKRRLQRDKDFTGERLSSFREVFLRHGLPGLGLALGLLLSPGLQRVFAESLARAAENAATYALVCAAILTALNAYNWFIDRRWGLAQLAWILYLGALSVWEEWVFRLALPHILEANGASVWVAAALSAALFGAAHYFTLRWKWHWCVGAGLGGLYFSHQMELHGDLLLVAAIHWVMTSINTPRPPSPTSTPETGSHEIGKGAD